MKTPPIPRPGSPGLGLRWRHERDQLTARGLSLLAAKLGARHEEHHSLNFRSCTRKDSYLPCGNSFRKSPVVKTRRPFRSQSSSFLCKSASFIFRITHRERSQLATLLSRYRWCAKKQNPQWADVRPTKSYQFLGVNHTVAVLMTSGRVAARGSP